MHDPASDRPSTPATARTQTRPAPRLREARPSDAAALAELGARTFVETFGADNRPEDMAAHLRDHFTVDEQARELADPAGRFVIAELGDEVVGYVRVVAGAAPAFVRASRPVEIARLYVARDHHGAGLGHALMRRALDDAHAAGHDVLWLGVWEHNHRARAFYRRWGFAEVGETPYVLGADVQRDLVLAVALPAASPAR